MMVVVIIGIPIQTMRSILLFLLLCWSNVGSLSSVSVGSCMTGIYSYVIAIIDLMVGLVYCF